MGSALELEVTWLHLRTDLALHVAGADLSLQSFSVTQNVAVATRVFEDLKHDPAHSCAIQSALCKPSFTFFTTCCSLIQPDLMNY